MGSSSAVLAFLASVETSRLRLRAPERKVAVAGTTGRPWSRQLNRAFGLLSATLLLLFLGVSCVRTPVPETNQPNLILIVTDDQNADTLAFMPNVQRLLGDRVTFAADEYEALQGADALLIATEWAEFRTPDLKRVGELLKEKLIFDGRNLFNPRLVAASGLTYHSIGRTRTDVQAPTVRS